MKKNTDNLFWGIILILVALGILAQQQGYIDFEAMSANTWTWIFGGAGLVFLVCYLISGLKKWGYLFPACVLGALAVIIALAEAGNNGEFLGSLIFIAVAIPFLVAFLTNIRENWWALIPAFGCLVLATVINFADTVAGEWIGALVMYGIGLPFLLVYFVNRTRRWALIPGLILVGIGTLSLVSVFNDWVNIIVCSIIAGTFFYVYFTQPEKWWALIPAGMMASIALESILTLPFLGAFASTSIPTGIMFLGWAGTFYYLWLQRAKAPTEWARIPAIVFVIVAIVQLVLGAMSEIGMIVLLFAGGILLIYFGLRPKKTV
ncbi:MAG: hypothetical protein ABIJ65_02195 [Chloroflexota bacterium]